MNEFIKDFCLLFGWCILIGVVGGIYIWVNT